MDLVRSVMQACQICPYDEASGQGELRYLQLTAAGSEASCRKAQNDPHAAIQVKATVGDCITETNFEEILEMIHQLEKNSFRKIKLKL